MRKPARFWKIPRKGRTRTNLNGSAAAWAAASYFMRPGGVAAGKRYDVHDGNSCSLFHWWGWPGNLWQTETPVSTRLVMNEDKVKGPAEKLSGRIRWLALLGGFVTVATLTTFAAPAAQVAPTSFVAAPSGANSNTKLRAAAEPFENLTEISFTAAWTTIDQTAAKAEAAAGGARGSLSKDAAVQLDAQIAAIKSALQRHDRAEVALSSIEGYRVLVSAVTDNAKIPTEVSLLDYAGFRYNANLKAHPIRWDEMAATVSFARKTWDTLLPRAKASPVATRFEKAITDMDKAVIQRNESLAASSVKTELDLVDQLEKFFSAH